MTRQFDRTCRWGVLAFALVFFTAAGAFGQEADEADLEAGEAIGEESAEAGAPDTDEAAEVLPVRAPADIAAEARLRDIFGAIDILQGVEVGVVHGVVRLTGTTATSRSRETAERIASRISDVVYVQNLVNVEEAPAAVEHVEVSQALKDEAIQERLTTIFGHITALDGARVRVRSGVVTLSGKALTPEARNQAEALATRTDGVIFVENQIVETTEVADRVAPTLERLREMTRSLVDRLPILAIALLVVLIFWYIAKYVVRMRIGVLQRSANPLVQSVFKQVLRTVVILIGVLIALDLLGATALVGAVVGAAGLAGLAIGFAFKDIVENYLASILLSMIRPFEPNDQVLIDKHAGKVIRLTTRETVLMTGDGNHLRIPNAVVFKSVICNYTRNPRRRFDFMVSIGCDESIRDAHEAGIQALLELEGILHEPLPTALTIELGDSDVKIRFIAWVDQRESSFGRAKSEAIRRVKNSLDAAGISMPAPTYRIENTLPTIEEEPRQRVPTPHAAHEDVVSLKSDGFLDRQIDEERRLNPETDLLEA